MKSYFRYSLLVVAMLGMVGCGEDEQAIDNTATSEEVVSNEGEQPNIISDADQPIPEEYQNPVAAPVESGGGDIDYGTAIDTKKGMQALEASREAVQMGIDSINKDQVKAIAGALAGKAAKFAKDNGAEIQSTDETGTWKKIYADSTNVLDGDTVDVYVDGQKKARIRLLGIDAPESSQEYGQNSGQTLENCIASGPVVVSYRHDDGKDRMLGKVVAGGVDCNYEQVKVGSAWHYKQYQNEQPASDRPLYSSSELQARSGQKGLWANPQPLEPWLYRRQNK